jgi:hypothetical protein
VPIGFAYAGGEDWTRENPASRAHAFKEGRKTFHTSDDFTGRSATTSP